VTASYLSRVENDHATPSVAILSKIAAAIGQPLAAFFDDGSSSEEENRCPVSLIGKCILDQRFRAHGRRASVNFKLEEYSEEQIQILRICNYLLHTGSPEVIASLAVMVRSLLAFTDQRGDAPGLIPSAACCDHGGGGPQSQSCGRSVLDRITDL
jgi:transcriptional regulator with XRE-family HTH domain